MAGDVLHAEAGLAPAVERVQDIAGAGQAGIGNGAANGAVALYDPAAAAVLTALERGAQKHLGRIRPKKTQDGYARDRVLWEEFHGWLTRRTGTQLPLNALTVGTLVGFVTWLAPVKQAAEPASATSARAAAFLTGTRPAPGRLHRRR
ncbi:hypothetical protein [Streptomyces nodosus]|uniref:hypothetical protein n=1 Tax=Streptomyces nodosus TaxID=40318 RepID=UPI001185CE9B|nr:hypothetical protein [Streptomyces nodosus]MBB4795095.1 hypothetical protein [Streptomyces nodosus]